MSKCFAEEKRVSEWSIEKGVETKVESLKRFEIVGEKVKDHSKLVLVPKRLIFIRFN